MNAFETKKITNGNFVMSPLKKMFPILIEISSSAAKPKTGNSGLALNAVCQNPSVKINPDQTPSSAYMVGYSKGARFLNARRKNEMIKKSKKSPIFFCIKNEVNLCILTTN